MAKREFALVRRSAVGDHIAFGDNVTHLDQRTLVNVGVLVGSCVLDQVVNIYTHIAGGSFGIVGANYDAGGVNIIHTTATLRGNHGTRVNSGGTLDACAHKRLLRTQTRHSLPLHV